MAITEAKVGGMSDLDAELTMMAREYTEAVLAKESAWNVLRKFVDQFGEEHPLHKGFENDWWTKHKRADDILDKMKEKFLSFF